MRSEMVTVFGGSGFIGRYVVRELCRHGYRVRVAVRHPHAAHDLRVAGEVGQVQLVQANVRNRPSIERAVEGAWGVVNLVGILFEEGRQRFQSTQARGAGQIAEAARDAGASHFVQMSAIGADETSGSRYARTKALGEKAVREAFPGAVILRPSVVFGPEDEFFNKFASMARFSPVLPLIGGGKTRFQPVYVGDVADAVVAALTDPAAAGRTYELGGPRIYTFKELMKLILKEVDRPRALAPIPFFAAGPMGSMGDFLGRLPFVKPPLTADQVRQLRRDNIVSENGDAGTLADLGIDRPQTVEAITSTYLGRYRKGGQFHERHA